MFARPQKGTEPWKCSDFYLWQSKIPSKTYKIDHFHYDIPSRKKYPIILNHSRNHHGYDLWYENHIRWVRCCKNKNRRNDSKSLRSIIGYHSFIRPLIPKSHYDQNSQIQIKCLGLTCKLRWSKENFWTFQVRSRSFRGRKNKHSLKT